MLNADLVIAREQVVAGDGAGRMTRGVVADRHGEERPLVAVLEIGLVGTVHVVHPSMSRLVLDRGLVGPSNLN